MKMQVEIEQLSEEFHEMILQRIAFCKYSALYELEVHHGVNIGAE